MTRSQLGLTVFGVLIGCILISQIVIPSTPPVAPAGQEVPTKSETAIVSGAPCKGTEIFFDYQYEGPDMSTPFTCSNSCDDLKGKPHYILYRNGYGAQCGIESCADYGEDHCITCEVPQAILTKYSLTKPATPPTCQKKVQ